MVNKQQPIAAAGRESDAHRPLRALHPPTFGDLLARHRIAAGLTQEQLAERATLSVRTLNYLEHGTTRPQKETVRLLADALGLGAEERALFAQTAHTRQAPTSLPALLHAPSHNLPAPVAPLVGRGDERAGIAALLRDSDVRLVTITGLGGVGKTRLSLAVAEALLPDFPDGVFFVSLAAIRDPAFVVSAIAQALDVRTESGQSLQKALGGFVRARRMLLVLDNFEQVLAAGIAVADLLAAGASLTILVTSRAPLHLRGEHEWAIEPLPLPPVGSAADPQEIMRSPACELFRQRAVAVRRDFQLTAENAETVAAICTGLDGLPLAIELAAARIKILLPSTLLARLKRRLPLLTDGASDLPERQRTMRGTIDWSYDLLGADEKRLFRWLTIFAGGFSLEAAEAVGSALSDGAVDVFTVLTLLVDKSLIRSGTRANAERFTMLETVWEYGLERLATSGETAAVQRAHAMYFLSLAETVESRLTGPSQAASLAQLEEEHDNLRAVLRWTREHHEAVMGLRLAGALWRFWQGHGHLEEGREWLEGLLALEERGDHDVPPLVRAKALSGSAMLAFRQNNCACAVALSEESLALYRAKGDHAGIADALNVRGLVADSLGDAPHAASLYAESLALYRKLGSTWEIATSLNNLGVLARAQGEYARASAFLAESLMLRRRLGDTWGTALALTNLGRIAQDQGDYAGAVPLHEESLLLRKTLEDRQGIAIALTNLGHIAWAQGESRHAALRYEEGLALSREIGDRKNTARALNGLGDVARQQGDMARAIALYEESARLNQSASHLLGVAESVERFALIAHDMEQQERTVRLLGAADTLRIAIGTPLPPTDRGPYDRVAAAVHAALGEETFATAWAAGAALTLDQTITEAIGVSDVIAPPAPHATPS